MEEMGKIMGVVDGVKRKGGWGEAEEVERGGIMGKGRVNGEKGEGERL
jgi:hypothetical protein